MSLFLNVAGTPPPGKVLNLKTFDALQIPEGKGKEGMTQIRHPELDKYSSKYFYTNPTDESEVVFWAPESGSVSGNGAGPRTELTEANNYFTFSGKHTMSYTMSIEKVPSDGKVCIGQIKGDSFDSYQDPEIVDDNNTTTLLKGSCLIVVELIYEARNNGLVTAHMRSKSGGGCSSEIFKLGNFGLNEKIQISMEVNGYNVYVSSNKVKANRYDYSFWKGKHYGMHFKVGVYDQTSCSSCSSGAKAKLSNLKITH